MMVKLADLLHRVLDRAHEELHALVTRTVRSKDALGILRRDGNAKLFSLLLSLLLRFPTLSLLPPSHSSQAKTTRIDGQKSLSMCTTPGVPWFSSSS